MTDGREGPGSAARTNGRLHVAVQASLPLAEGLLLGLTREDTRASTLEHALAAGTIPDLVVCEAALAATPAVAQALEQEPSLPWLSLGMWREPSGATPILHTLPADATVAEIVAKVRELLFGDAAPSVPAAANSSPSPPVSVLPRRAERTVSQPPSLRTPTSLLPKPQQQSSTPPRLRSVPPAPPSAGGRLIDDLHAVPRQVSGDLLELLASAERRVKEEISAVRDFEVPLGNAVELELSEGLLAALTQPIGDYESSEGERGAHRVAPTHAGSAPERTGLDELTDAPTSSNVLNKERARSSPRPGEQPKEASFADKDTDGGRERRASEALFAGVDHLQRTRPPRTATAAATQRAATPLPKAPALPSDAWVESTMAQPPHAGDLTGVGTAELIGPHTSRSAQPDRLFEPDSDPATADALPHVSESISTVPPSAATGSAALLGLPTTEQGNAPSADRTTRPPRRPDTAPPLSSAPSQTSVPSPASPALGAATVPKAMSGATNLPAGSAPLAAETADVMELAEGDAIVALATAIRSRFTGAIAFESERGIRRVVLRDGDLVTAASGVPSESLISYLVSAGLLGAEASTQLGHRLPSFGRHAGAALIAGGYLAQEQLWPTLRAHAEFIVGRALAQTRGVAAMERSIPERLQAEPSVFGGATGSEVLVEIVRRVVSPNAALERLGGEHVRVKPGSHYRLLDECALTDAERHSLGQFERASLGDVLAAASSDELVCVVYALRELAVLSVTRSIPVEAAQASERRHDPLDDEALRQAVRARRALVDNGDYFAVLGVPRSATGYHIRRAFLDLRKRFEPSLVVRPGTLELKDDIELIVDVLDEAYQVLKDPLRRDRYRRALEAVPPGPR